MTCIPPLPHSHALIFSLLTFSLITGLAAAPWLIRNFILTKNPFYPALSGIFGLGEFMRPMAQAIDLVGLNPDLLAFIRLPWDMTFYPFKFGSFSHIGPIFLIFLPLLFWVKRKTSEFKYLGWFSLCLFLLLFFLLTVTIPHTRYYLIGIVVLSILIAYLVVTWIDGRNGTTPFLLKHVIGLTIGFIIVYNIYLFIYLASILFNPLPATFNLKSEEEYLTSQLNYYPAAQFINKTLPFDVKVLLVGEMRSYYIERPMLLNTTPNTTVIVDLINASKGISDLLTKLKNLGVTHILFNSQEARELQRQFSYFNFPGKREEDLYNEFVKNYLRLLFSKNEVYIFEVK